LESFEVHNVKGEKHELKRSLSLLDAAAINIGAIVGAGIFVVTGIAAGVAGSAVVVSILLAGIVSLFTAMSFSELSAHFPKEGGAYEFARRMISPFAGFSAGWMWVVSNVFGGTAVALGFANYLGTIFPLLPQQYAAAVLCALFTLLNILGVKRSAQLNNALVAAKLAILVFFFAVGIWHANAENFHPFEPIKTGVLYGAFYIFFAYGGFARVTIIAEEIKNPERNVPRAIIISLLVSTFFYVLVGATAVGLVGASRLSSSGSPLTEAISAVGSNAATYVVSVGGLLATASVLLTTILGVSRLSYSMAREGDLPHFLERLHPKRGTPHYSIIASGLLMVALVLFADLGRVVAVSIFGLLFYYLLANLSALRLKKAERRYHPSVPLIGAATCIILLISAAFISPTALIVGAIAFAACVIYYAVNRKFGKRIESK
jgi:APA family basic amino acid/polyamine antiporter